MNITGPNGEKSQIQKHKDDGSGGCPDGARCEANIDNATIGGTDLKLSFFPDIIYTWEKNQATVDMLCGLNVPYDDAVETAVNLYFDQPLRNDTRTRFETVSWLLIGTTTGRDQLGQVQKEVIVGTSDRPTPAAQYFNISVSDVRSAKVGDDAFQKRLAENAANLSEALAQQALLDAQLDNVAKQGELYSAQAAVLKTAMDAIGCLPTDYAACINALQATLSGNPANNQQIQQ